MENGANIQLEAEKSAELCIGRLEAAINAIDNDTKETGRQEPGAYIDAVSDIIVDIEKNGTGCYCRLLKTREKAANTKSEATFHAKLMDTVLMLEKQYNAGNIRIVNGAVEYFWTRIM